MFCSRVQRDSLLIRKCLLNEAFCIKFIFAKNLITWFQFKQMHEILTTGKLVFQNVMLQCFTQLHVFQKNSFDALILINSTSRNKNKSQPKQIAAFYNSSISSVHCPGNPFTKWQVLLYLLNADLGTSFPGSKTIKHRRFTMLLLVLLFWTARCGTWQLV